MIAFSLLLIVPIAYQLFSTLFIKSNQIIHVASLFKEIIYRIPVFAAILLPAFYLANESRKQREKEFKYRDFEIKVSASGPYIDNISDNIIGNQQTSVISKKDELRIELAKEFFGHMYDEDKESNVVIPKDVLVLFEKTLDKIHK